MFRIHLLKFGLGVSYTFSTFKKSRAKITTFSTFKKSRAKITTFSTFKKSIANLFILHPFTF